MRPRTKTVQSHTVLGVYPVPESEPHSSRNSLMSFGVYAPLRGQNGRLVWVLIQL